MSMFDQLVARLRDEQALTKSLNPGDALAAVGNGDANAPVLDQRALTIGVAPGVVACHNARLNQIADAQLLQEVRASGVVSAADAVALDNALAASRHLPPEARAAGMESVRQQLNAAAAAPLSPAARGINWDE
ncbi:hypothetical protein NMD51_24810 (plasmid) [Escherichia coli]|jgi:hypothetical protein|uniref:Uncharacterized protein n=4 Tax=Enterobacteriaceae TaxID=543 RepID=A0A5U2MHW3_SALER|nr:MULTISPECIES: hypothetical protein [Enterobacterales]EAN3010315.1 hypothetical protein [Salmonella enterica]ECH9039922.1 hypothetical protein [Salmonella enterica subsp. enterica]EDG5659598.1 hypothetical protein [Salmonella enterica subsp. enterica serovar Newport]EDJ2552760.1 hypothetical protein [Salmonella enterica subsp. enterica serovar Stanley]EHE2088286.1 hypothetical protein [Salmonella enterica subsp. enterica serovar Havana]EHJ8262572.1 hypothetical protein [Salmonella enterica 